VTRGRELPFGQSADQSFEGLLHSETCLTTYACNSARAAVGDSLRRCPQCCLDRTSLDIAESNGILARKTLSGASFASIDQLVQAIEAFIASYNQSAAPFVWRKREVKGSQLRNTLVNLRN